jgi:Tfp pilus assembly protein PilF
MGLMKGTVVVLGISLGLLLFLGQSVHAEIYKWIDEKGTTHFTEDLSVIPKRYKDQTKSEKTEKNHMSLEEKAGAKKELENKSDEIRLENQKELKQARDSLDSWSGQREILSKAKNTLDHIIATDSQNYLALKELARYYIMDGYINSISVGNCGRKYSVGRYTAGCLEGAEKILKDALRLNPNYAEGYVLLGHLNFQERRLDDARVALSKAQSLGTDDPWLHLNWADVLIASGQLDEAANRCRLVLKNGTKNKKALIAAYECLIKYHRNRKESQKVSELYQAMLEINPTNAWTRGNYADFLRTDVGKFDDAITYAREALRIMNYGVGRRILAESLYGKWADLIVNQKKSEIEAQQYYDEAFRLYPNLDLVMAYEGSYAKGKALVQLLKAKGISMDARAEDGSTALMIASNTGRADAVRILLSLGANPNAKADTGWTALLGAADEGNQEIVKLLLDAGADPKQARRGTDAGMLAERCGQVELATMIRQYAIYPKK